MGASSIGGGTTRGRGGSDVVAWTNVSLGILRPVDGDEDLAPRVLAMAGRRRWAEVRAPEVQMRGRRWRVALFLAPLWYYLKFK